MNDVIITMIGQRLPGTNIMMKKDKVMPEELNTPDIDALLNIFSDAIRNKFKAVELENEALKMRLNEARLKLELAKAKLEEAGVDASILDFTSTI